MILRSVAIGGNSIGGRRLRINQYRGTQCGGSCRNKLASRYPADRKKSIVRDGLLHHSLTTNVRAAHFSTGENLPCCDLLRGITDRPHDSEGAAIFLVINAQRSTVRTRVTVLVVLCYCQGVATKICLKLYRSIEKLTPESSLEIEIGLIGFGLSGRAFHAPVIQAVSGLRPAAILRKPRPWLGKALGDFGVRRGIGRCAGEPRPY